MTDVVMELVIAPGGDGRCIYSEMLDLLVLGKVQIRRGSYVEPDSRGRWWVDLSPVGGPMAGPFELRSQALEAEHLWLLEHWLRIPA